MSAIKRFPEKEYKDRFLDFTVSLSRTAVVDPRTVGAGAAAAIGTGGGGGARNWQVFPSACAAHAWTDDREPSRYQWPALREAVPPLPPE